MRWTVLLLCWDFTACWSQSFFYAKQCNLLPRPCHECTSHSRIKLTTGDFLNDGGTISLADYRKMMAIQRTPGDAEKKYRSLDIRGDSTAVLRARVTDQIHPVAAAMHERKRSGSRPGKRKDKRRIALSIEGGGMRGCIAAGMAAAVRELGLVDSIDAVYGSSAGSLIGAYLLSGQDYRFGCSIYYDDLCGAGRTFIDLRNAMRSLGLGALRLTRTGITELLQERLGTPVLNLDFLLDEVMQKRKPLDWEALAAKQSTQPLRILASGLETESAVVLGAAEGHFSDSTQLAQCIRASMLLPGIAGPVVNLPQMGDDKQPLADAMLFEPIPYRAALAEGATHVLVLRTRPDGINVVRKQAIVEKLIAHRFFRRKMKLPRMAEHMWQQRHRILYAEDILRLNEGVMQLDTAAPTPHLLPIALQRGPSIDNLQTDATALYHAVRCGFARAYEVLRPPDTPCDGWSAALEAFPDSILNELLLMPTRAACKMELRAEISQLQKKIMAQQQEVMRLQDRLYALYDED
mmetsp:Transcript_27280/g.45471  ORF Transcript_27280/g.45471 Transcript_27280/m.45471 type:complete len:520 (+) Transcript_27280:25-1584(+)